MMTQDQIFQFGGQPVGPVPPPQDDVYWVDNIHTANSDSNTGLKRNKPKSTIQSAIDASVAAATKSYGATIYVMGSGSIPEYHGTGFHALTGTSLYGIYREQIQIPYNANGLRLIGINRPLITGQAGTAENLTGYIPTIQIGSYGVDANGPLYCVINGFHIGGFGDDGDDAADSNRYGVGIAIGEYDDTNYNDDCYSHLIENCWFRKTNCVAAAQTNDEDVHTWIKGWGNEKIVVRGCYFFMGQYAMGFMGSTLNQSMMWKVEDCQFHYQATACLMSSASPLWMDVNHCLFNPQATNTEFALAGGLGSIIRNSQFPLCDEAVLTNSAKVNTPTLGTYTGWTIQNCGAQKGLVFGA